ncbi:MAG: hypothetical protein GX879_03125, partial [Bacteroidales bacterium]|nr:hypothetical protein [Bacteroidales bacterium]
MCLFSVLSYSQLYASSPSVKSGNPKVFYVSKDGDDSNNGESWEQALENIQTAIDWANAYTGDAEVWVAKGVYEPTA